MGIWIDGKPIYRTVHALMAEAFLGPRMEGMEAHLIDGDRTNTTLSNIHWATRSQAMAAMRERGTMWQQQRTHCPKGHPYNEANTYVRPSDGCRQCRMCRKQSPLIS